MPSSSYNIIPSPANALTGETPKLMGSIEINLNTKYRYDLLDANLKLLHLNLIADKNIGSGAFKTFYELKNDKSVSINEFVFGKYENDKDEDNGLRKQKELKDGSNNNYIPDIIENGRLSNTQDTLEQTEPKHSYVIMEKVNGIEFAVLVNFILKSCLIFNNVGDCIRFKNVDELKREGINENSLQFKFFSEVILQPLNVRVNILKYLFQELLNAVNELHKKRKLHLDIKLQNVMIYYDNESGNAYKKFKVKIIDFGFCEEKTNATLGIIGTKNYFNIHLLYLCSVFNNDKYKPLIINSNLNSKTDGLMYYDNLFTKIKETNKSDKFRQRKTFEYIDDIYPLGMMFQVIFVICILNATGFNKYFNEDGKKLRDIEKWYPGLNLGHFIEKFDYVRYIYKNIIDLYLLLNTDKLPDNFNYLEQLFHSIDLFEGLKNNLKNNFDAISDDDDKFFNSLLIDEVNEFYYRNQEPGTGAVQENDKALFEKIKKLTSASGEGIITKKICQQCFLLLKIVRKMLGTGIPEPDFDSINKILTYLNKFDKDVDLVTIQNEELKFVCDIDDKITPLGGGGRQVGGRNPPGSTLVTKLHQNFTESLLTTQKSSPPIVPSNTQSPIEEAQVINFNIFDEGKKPIVNTLFQKHYHSSFDMDDYLKEETINIGDVEIKNNIFIKPISRTPYEKTNPFSDGSTPSEYEFTEGSFTQKQKELIDKINSLKEGSKKNKLKNHFSVLFPELSESTTQIQGSKEPTKDLDKTIGMIDREVCYEILNDTETFSENRNKPLQNKLKEAFGFTETKLTTKKVGGFRKKRKSSKTKKRKLSKTNKRQSSKNNKRKSSTLGNKITLKNKKYKNVNKRKNHLKVIKTKITKKKINS